MIGFRKLVLAGYPSMPCSLPSAPVAEFHVEADAAGSPTGKAGSRYRRFTSVADDPCELLAACAAPVLFCGVERGGRTLIYRFRLEFSRPVVIDRVDLVGAGFHPLPGGGASRVRLLDGRRREIACFDTEGEDRYAIISLTPPLHVPGTTFYLEEYDGSPTWRYRERIVLKFSTPRPGAGRPSGPVAALRSREQTSRRAVPR